MKKLYMTLEEKIMSWTNDRIDLLMKLWGEGKTAAEIAKSLGGVTRNAVIGKAHRLKLSGRIANTQDESPVKTAQKSSKSKSDSKSSQSRQIHKHHESDIAAPVVEVALLEDDYCAGEGIQLVELKEGLCRWPIGDPKEAGFKFCGAKAQSGMIYCTHHCHVAYQAPAKSKLRVEELAKIDADIIRKKA
ncbi:MAG: gcrA cell cycle regulator family protein [Alphaproteobacteria bacterium]|nr:gcrA cell cycle regulator family protein [Alphaproteobacteria bacterium]